jgi:hypothetical protein
VAWRLWAIGGRCAHTHTHAHICLCVRRTNLEVECSVLCVGREGHVDIVNIIIITINITPPCPSKSTHLVLPTSTGLSSGLSSVSALAQRREQSGLSWLQVCVCADVSSRCNVPHQSVELWPQHTQAHSTASRRSLWPFEDEHRLSQVSQVCGGCCAPRTPSCTSSCRLTAPAHTQRSRIQGPCPTTNGRGEGANL